jgi:hypothetical protein
MHSECNNVAHHRLENRLVNKMENAISLYLYNVLRACPYFCICLPLITLESTDRLL